MEGFDDDDFSDLYADVEVQASSAISALHRSTKTPPRNGSIFAIASRGEKKVANGPSRAEIDGGNRKFNERDASREKAEEEKGGGGGFGLRNLPVENGVRCGSGSGSGSGNMSAEDEDGIEHKIGDNYDSEKYDDRSNDIESGEIAAKENVNGGDYTSQRKVLEYNSLDCKKKTVDDMAQQVHRTCKQGDADDRDPFSSRAREDNQPNYGRKHGGPKISPERHTQACYPVPSDSYEHGSVQISDSLEDSPHVMSECDSEGMSETSDDTQRRKSSCISNKVSPELEPESSESGRSQHGRGYSSSPSRAALSSKYIEKSNNRSRYSSSSLRCELREPMSREYRPPKDSDNHGVKRGTRDGRYSEGWRDGIRDHSNQPKKSNYIPYLNNRPDEDASYPIDAKHLYSRDANHGKQRAMVTSKYNESGPNCSHSERIMTYSGGSLLDHHLGPALLKHQYGDIPNHRYKAGHPYGHSMSERKNIIDKKSSQMDHEAFEYNRFHNQWRHPFQGDIGSLRNLSPKYSSAFDQRGTQYKREDVHLRRIRQDYLSPLLDYDSRFVEGKYRRICPNSSGDSDHLDLRFDQNVAHDRRDMDSFGRGKRRHHSPLNSSENISYIETEFNGKRNIKHRPFSFYSSEEAYASGRRDFVGASGPKSGVGQRNMRFSWKEMRRECDQYGTDVATFVTRESLRYHPPKDYHVKRRDYQQSPNTYITRESINVDQYQDNFVGRRHHLHSEAVHLRGDVKKSRHQHNTVFSSEEPSYHLKRISKNDEADDRPAFCHVTELNEREMGRQNSNMLREEDYNIHFDGCRKSTQLHSHVQMLPSHQDPVGSLVVVGRKCSLQSSIRRITDAGEDTYYGRCDLRGGNDNKEPNDYEDLDEFNPEKTVTVTTDEGKLNASISDRNQQSKFSKTQQKFLEIEEGQIVTEEMHNATKRTRASEDASQMNVTGHPETASNGNGVVERLDDAKIRDIMMKMERRRERFKEIIPTSRDSEKPSCPLPDSNVETTEAKLERPARKRRWLGT